MTWMTRTTLRIDHMYLPIVAYALAIASASSPCSGCVSARTAPDRHCVRLNSLSASSEGGQGRRFTRRSNQMCVQEILIRTHSCICVIAFTGPVALHEVHGLLQVILKLLQPATHI